MSRRESGPAPQVLIVALAQAFKLTRPAAVALLPQWRRDVAVVAGVLKSFNATLDRERFFTEAGESNTNPEREKP